MRVYSVASLNAYTLQGTYDIFDSLEKAKAYVDKTFTHMIVIQNWNEQSFNEHRSWTKEMYYSGPLYTSKKSTVYIVVEYDVK